ncbi:MAG: type I-E CRISPR-associated protein Cse2/CasB [Alcaligenaceae bacterium]|nr:type I-E CRISPR-associated protein Cse2/CasB [Alcaligenaceae bacterium]
MKNRNSVLDDAQRSWVRNWWRALQPPDEKWEPLPPALRGLDRGERAALRRAADGDALLMESSTHLLARGLVTLDAKRDWPQLRNETEAYLAIALVAGVLAGVRDDASDDLSLAHRLGHASGNRPRMSELRFKRLLKASDETDLLRQWRRAVDLADRKADVARLADDLLGWQIEQARPQASASRSVRFRWAYDYYLTTRQQNAGEEPESIKEITE